MTATRSRCRPAGRSSISIPIQVSAFVTTSMRSISAILAPTRTVLRILSAERRQSPLPMPACRARRPHCTSGPRSAHGGLGAGLPAGSARSRVGSVPSTLSWLDQYGQQHEFQGSVARSDVSVTGTYAGDPAQVEDIIRGMRKLWAQPSGTGAPGAARTREPDRPWPAAGTPGRPRRSPARRSGRCPSRPAGRSGGARPGIHGGARVHGGARHLNGARVRAGARHLRRTYVHASVDAYVSVDAHAQQHRPAL